MFGYGLRRLEFKYVDFSASCSTRYVSPWTCSYSVNLSMIYIYIRAYQHNRLKLLGAFKYSINLIYSSRSSALQSIKYS